jgi:uncharacterized membrane protein
MKAKKVAFIGIVTGLFIVLLAYAFNWYTIRNETVIGPNIGAGLLALLGIAITVSSLVLLVFTVVTKFARKNK